MSTIVGLWCKRGRIRTHIVGVEDQYSTIKLLSFISYLLTNNFKQFYQEYFLKEYSLIKSFFPVCIRWGNPKLFHHNKKCSNGNAQTLIGMWW